MTPNEISYPEYRGRGLAGEEWRQCSDEKTITCTERLLAVFLSLVLGSGYNVHIYSFNTFTEFQMMFCSLVTWHRVQQMEILRPVLVFSWRRQIKAT